ncbi:MAG TPA: ANTAR domain-containing protein [Pseudonocardia sp.]
MFDALGDGLRAADSSSPFEAVVHTAVKRVPGADSASITTYRRAEFVTAATTDERAHQADILQYELGSGPCVDAIVEDTIYRPPDLAHDRRWPEYGRRVSTECGWASMLSYRLSTQLMTEDMAAGLNIYSGHTHAFDDVAAQIGLLLATHAAATIAAELYHDRARNLQRALETSREIGVASGVLMNQYKLTREQAFNLLRIASQHTNRKLHDIATEVGDTGALPPGAINPPRPSTST